MNIASLLARVQKKGAPKVGSGKRHPQRDWLLLMGSTLFVFFIMALWSYVAFLFQLSDSDQAAESQKIPNLKMVSVETIQNIFEKRASVREGYQSTGYFVDPSR